jgi:hypothetical protein
MSCRGTAPLKKLMWRTQECVRYNASSLALVDQQAHGHSVEDERPKSANGRGSVRPDRRIPSRERKRPVLLVLQRLHHFLASRISL